MTPVVEKFINFVKFNTTANENSNTCPSSTGQIAFGKYLVEHCKKMGIKDVSINENGYVYAFIPKNAEGFYKIGFIAHMDTSPDASGENINPIIIENYNGDIIQRATLPLSPQVFPTLKNYIGKTIITSDGTTLLGADDKAGIAEILTAMEIILNNPTIAHGDISIAFTPDEEIGKGADLFDVAAFGCDFAYTIDGGELGELEYENFNAARAKISITGTNVHPGTAKGLMKNAILIGTEIANALPVNETPSATEGYEGFYHLMAFNGSVTQCNMAYIIRDFHKTDFEKRKVTLSTIIDSINKKYGPVATLELYDEYQNMLEKIQPVYHIVDLAKKAMLESGVTPIIKPIRGGTDGARLSFMGLPCPNIFTGGHNFHGAYEFIVAQSMESAVGVITKIVTLAKK